MYPSIHRSLLYTTSNLCWIVAGCVLLRRLAVEAFPLHVLDGVVTSSRTSGFTNFYYSQNIPTSTRRRLFESISRNELESSLSRLYMAAGSKSLNKQAALRQKMEQAKQQNFEQQQNSTSSTVSSSVSYPFTDQEIRARNDRLRFEELLQKKGGAFIDSENDNEYKTRQQEDDEIDAVRSGRDLLFEGDPAPTDCFEELVSIKTENAIGLSGKQRLVPWLRKNVARQQDYVVLLTDPRPQSVELRESIKVIMNELPFEIKQRLIVINADSPAENRRWLKRIGLYNSNAEDSIATKSPSSISSSSSSSVIISKATPQKSPSPSSPLVQSLEVYSDEKMEFMRTFTALGEQRWTMTMYILSTERIQKLVRNVDQYTATRTIQNAIKAYMDETKLTIKKNQ